MLSRSFLLPSIFDDLDAFQAWFDFDFQEEGTEEKIVQSEMQNSVVTKLHQILRPFLLRRLKQDVEIGLPKKYEYILFSWMSDWQVRACVCSAAFPSLICCFRG